jgi:26S proteasome regulatory subunit N5
VRKGSESVEALEGDEPTKLALIETLRAVSEGKMFVEVERARLTKTLATMHEARGDIVEARKIMIETVVETLGGMGKREKTNFILEQVRLCLDSGEFVRAQIMARKINVKVFKSDEIEDLKLTYYNLIVRYHMHECTWMEIFRAYQAMWDTPSLQADADAAAANLKRQCIFLMLSPADKDRTEQLHILKGIKKVAAPLPAFHLAPPTVAHPPIVNPPAARRHVPPDP